MGREQVCVCGPVEVFDRGHLAEADTKEDEVCRNEEDAKHDCSTQGLFRFV